MINEMAYVLESNRIARVHEKRIEAGLISHDFPVYEDELTNDELKLLAYEREVAEKINVMMNKKSGMDNGELIHDSFQALNLLDEYFYYMIMTRPDDFYGNGCLDIARCCNCKGCGFAMIVIFNDLVESGSIKSEFYDNEYGKGVYYWIDDLETLINDFDNHIEFYLKNSVVGVSKV